MCLGHRLMVIKMIAINTRLIKYILCFFVLFPPLIIETAFAYGDTAFKLLQLMVLGYILYIGFKKRLVVFSHFELAIGVFILCGVVTNVLHSPKSTFVYLMSVAYPILEATLLCMIMMGNDYDETMDGFAYYYSIIMWLNAFSMILFPTGIIRTSASSSYTRAFWLLGSKNVIVHTMPLYMMAIMYLHNKKKSLLTTLTLIVALLSFSSMGSEGVELLHGSSTCIIEGIVFMILYSFKDETIFKRLVYGITLSVSTVLCMLASIVFVRIGDIGGVSSLVRVLGKDTTFSSRTYNWNRLVLLIKDNWVLGIGNQVIRFRVFDTYSESIYTQFGSLLLRYGVIGMLAFLIVLICADKNADRSIDYCIKYLRISFMVMSIGGLMYELSWKPYFLLIAMTYYTHAFDGVKGVCCNVDK